ncbi:hypothetical protein ABB37_09270 [Leptomonas pyrrhocoris]|uniref:Vacuolar membrane-associated protein Iml1 N-terminal domain-containing protein n=1 Tax=Leptomonas pyrrhocoris TaxID=157538 RepID=A0A0M9FRA3_LEPPY|nr:hypothetical protein ABB37_09270 [Leptomonas pyrrhocoris]KPA74266.1 hypothetical protein ABB37_09270 [Leptomonas pyrrhocoris]|eukprot:XP_015652705.1 hypothetical protein ABB37_09270 [Leptomonas pyrrhocoris]
MSAVKGATLRRQQRHRHTPDAAHGCDTPIPLVFRTHNDGLSKAAFLFCPKNFNLVNPTTAAAAASPNAASPNSTSGSPAGAARHGAGVPNASGAGSPSNPKRFAASTSPAATTAAATATATAATAASAAPSADAESVRTLVEAIVELRPFFAPPLFNSSTNSGSTMNLSALVSGSPPTASTAHLDQSPSFNSLMVRPSSSASLGLGSYVDLMSLSSFASPTAYGGGAGANDSFNFSGTVTSAATGRYEDRPRAAGSPRAVGSAGGGQRMRPAAPHAAYAGGPGMLGGSSVHHNAGSSSSGGGGGGGAAGAGAGAAGGSGGVAGAAHTAIGTSASSLMHPSGGWICRAMAFNEKEVSHANGAISVNQSLTAKCALINEVAKGKIMARILSSYEEVQERYGLSHVELTVDNQYVSRSDLFLLSQALRERILYEGEEIHLCGFRLRVREMLQVVSSGSGPSPVSSSPAIPISAPTTGAGSGSGASPANIANTPANNTGGTSSYVRVGCGLVLPTTRINFQSLSPVHYIVVELAREMWDTTIDGRIALTWALRKFLSELLLKQLPKRKASPLIRVVFTGRLQKEFQFDRHGDVFHVLELPREARNVDVVEEVRMHCEALVDRVLREVQTTAYHQLEAEVAAYRDGRAGRGGGGSGEQQPRGGGGAAGGWREGEGDSGVYSSPTTTSPDRDAALEAYVRQRQTYIDAITPKRLFVHAKQSNTLEALSILVERSNHHYIDRHLTLSGHAITVVSAGKGFYQVTNSLVQIVCARLHDMGLEKVHVVCIGRPPLHVTPLLEYTADDDTLRSQYHLHSRALSSTGAARGGAHAPSTAVERYYETPEWISVFFFHSALSNNGGETVFELLPKEHWQREHPVMSIADMMWQPQELRSSPTPASLQQQQQQQLRSSPNSGGASAGSAGKTLLGTAQAGGGRHSDYVKGGEEDGHYATSNAAARQRGDLDEPAPAAAEGGPGCEPVGHGGGVEDVASAHHVSADAAANPPLLIPGLGLRFYPLADVTLPVATAAAASADFSVDRWESKSAMCADDGNATSAAATAVSPTWASRSYFPDVLEVSATASHGTDLLPSLASPASHHASLGPRTKTSTTAGRASPVFAAGGAASSPLLVRTTTASSSVFTSPNVPMRGSMPRAGAPAMAAAWREHHHTLHGLHSSLNASQPHLAYPPHPAFAGAFPPLLQPSSTSPQRRGSGDGPRRDAEVGTGGSAQRRVRGGGSVGATTTAAVRMPPYPSSSSIAVSASGAGDGRRHSQPNSLTSYTMMSHPSLHISRSFDYQTTANPTYHSLGAFERSVRSAGSSLTGRHHHHNSSPSSHLQPRSLLCREGSVAKSSGNSICGRPPASGAAAAAAAAAVNESGAGLQSLEGGGGVGGAPLRRARGTAYTPRS